MKKISFMAFAVIFGLIALALPRTAKAALTCGTAGTEGMPTCNSVSNPGEKCCVPAYHKGIKTVVKTGTKTQAHATHVMNSSVAEQSHTAVAAPAQTAPAVNAPTPSPIVPSVSSSVGKTESAQSAPAAMAPSAPSAPSAPAAAASTSSSAKAASK